MVSNCYSFTEKAKVDIEDIIEYIALSLSNPKAARDLLNELEKTIKIVSAFPEMYPIIDNKLVKAEIRKVNINSYVLYYLFKKKENIIVFLRFVYGKRDLDNFFKRLLA